MLGYELETVVPRIRIPSLVLRGARDPICKHDWAARLAGLLPAGRLVEVPHAPHVAMWRRPPAVARELVALAGEAR
jgi:pimeloyl-ACP methyl ester carboxylesterase